MRKKQTNVEFMQTGGISRDQAIAVEIQDASFTWSKDLPPVLSHVNVSVKKGELVAVVGSVGSGKSSLLCR